MMQFRKYAMFIKQSGILLFFYYVLRKSFFLFYKKTFRYCGSIFLTGSFKITGKQNINIGKLSAGDRFRMDAIIYSINDNTVYTPKITIGYNVSFGNDMHIGCNSKIIIGNNVLAASHVFISDHDHGVYDGILPHSSPLEAPAARVLSKDAYIIIEDNVFIGEYVSIMKNVIIHKGAVIGAHSVVTKDVPEYSIVVGNPAKVIKLFSFDDNKWKSVIS